MKQISSTDPSLGQLAIRGQHRKHIISHLWAIGISQNELRKLVLQSYMDPEGFERATERFLPQVSGKKITDGNDDGALEALEAQDRWVANEQEKYIDSFSEDY
jgi:hypothetical protein